MSNFTVAYSSGYFQFTDPSDNVISFKNIDALSIGGTSYKLIYDGTDGTNSINTGAGYSDPSTHSASRSEGLGTYDNNIISSAFYGNTVGAVNLFSFGADQGSNFTISSLTNFGYSSSDNLTITGTGFNDVISDRGEWSGTGNLNISAGAGTDIIAITTSKGSDTIDAGTGNDFVYVSAESGRSFTGDTSINGGTETDWLIIESWSSDLIYTINSGVTSGFENISIYGNKDDTIIGDTNANTIEGGAGSDTISGGDGDDILYGYFSGSGFGMSDGGDTLNGGLGNDTLIAGSGDDILDGGVGADILTGDGGADDYARGGSTGTDTFILRLGDGGNSLTNADTITDFQDGTDVLGLDNGLQYTDLAIAQGTGDNASDTIISSGSEYLAILQGINASNINYMDFASMATGDQSFTGTTKDDIFIGAAGADTVTTNIGTDVILTSSGDDIITVDGTGTKTIDGGAGTDTLNINYNSYGVSNFTVAYSSGYFQFTDPSDNVISFKNIDALSIGGTSYKLIYDGTDGTNSINTGAGYSDPSTHSASRSEGLGTYDNNIISSAFYGNTVGAVNLFSFGADQGSNFTISSLTNFGYSSSDNLTITGTGFNDVISDRGEWSGTGNLNISAGAGTDIIAITTSKGSDTIDAGTGNDFVYVSAESGREQPHLSGPI